MNEENLNIDGKELVSPSEVWSVLQFANALSNPNNAFFTPQMMANNLLLLNNQQLTPSLETIQKALLDVKNSQTTIAQFTQSMENTDMIFRKTIEYLSNMLSFDLIITCKNAKGKDYKSKEYKEDLDRVYKYLDNFDYKHQFRKVVKQMLRSEQYFTCLRDESPNGYTLQTLPQDMCLITGVMNNDILLFDFNFTYFLRGVTDINQYPEHFKSHFNEVMDGEGMAYVPTAQPDDRNYTYALWSQLSPTLDKAWAWKFSLDNFACNPYLAPMMQDVILNNQIRLLQRDKDIASAVALLFGEMAMLDGQKSGQVKDAFAVDPSTLGMMLQLVQNGLNKNIKVNAMPAKDLSWYQYKDENPDMYEAQVKNSSGMGASASRVIYSNDKVSQTELQNQIITDGNIMKKLYSQFKTFLEYYVNKKTRSFKFSFDFEGIDYPFERKERLDNLVTLADRGIVLNESTWASAIGMTPQAFDRALDEAKNGGFGDKLSLLLSIHTQGDGEDKGGRKVQKRVADSGETSRDYQ